jgi:hypothetical protein
MKTRCYNIKSTGYEDYGGRGIIVCERWKNSFSNFLEDMGKRPSIRHTLDRYPNVNGNYEPDNCRWATWEEQARNRRNSVVLEIDGVKKPMPEWCEIYGINWFTIRDRLKTGMTAKEAFTIPIGKKTEKIYLTHNGLTMDLEYWSKKIGIGVHTIRTRIKRGWSPEQVLTLPKIPVGCKRKYLYK